MKAALLAAVLLTAACARKIPCGDKTCDARDQYCEIYLSDVPQLPTGHHCQPLPAKCKPNATCACFPVDTPCLSFCGPLGEGLHLTCQGVPDPHDRTRQP